MSELVVALTDLSQYLDGVYDWVLKTREGLTREEAKRIFQRYRTGGEAPQDSDPRQSPPSPTPNIPPPPQQAGQVPQPNRVAAQIQERLSHQSEQITQILGYMEQTTQRLDLIESDIVYIKEKVDAILKKL